MASSLSTMEVSHKRGLGGLLVGTTVGFGASVLLGTLYGKYREHWWGQWMPAFFAAGGKALAVGLFLLGKGKWHIPVVAMNDLGQAGVNALGLDLGVKAGLKWAGTELHVGTKAELAAGHGHRIAGELPPAEHGRSLDEIAVEDFANLR